MKLLSFYLFLELQFFKRDNKFSPIILINSWGITYDKRRWSSRKTQPG